MRPIQYAIFKCAGMQRCISRTGQRFLAAGGPAPAHTSASRRGVSKPSHNRRSNEGNIHEPNAAIMSTAVGNIENKSKKRVALVVGYVGTRYHGLQDNKNPSWPTIEQHLEEALYQAGD